MDSVRAIASCMHKASAELTKERFIDEHALEKCTVCNNVIDNVVEAACCQELFCVDCICTWLASSSQCPVCAAPMRASELKQPGRVLARIIGNWSVRCDFHMQSLQGCPAVVPLRSLKEHVATCSFDPATDTPPIRTVRPLSTVEDVLSASPSKCVAVNAHVCACMCVCVHAHVRVCVCGGGGGGGRLCV